MALMTEAGHADTELELISLDDDFNRNTCDAVAAQMRDAGMKVKRTVLPGNTFWNNWLGYPFSVDRVEHAARSACRSIRSPTGPAVAWNETGFSNAEFDDLLTQAYAIADPDKRREVMAKMEKIIQDSGDPGAALLALDLPAHDARRARARHASDLRDPSGEDLAGAGLTRPPPPSGPAARRRTGPSHGGRDARLPRSNASA